MPISAHVIPELSDVARRLRDLAERARPEDETSNNYLIARKRVNIPVCEVFEALAGQLEAINLQDIPDESERKDYQLDCVKRVLLEIVKYRGDHREVTHDFHLDMADFLYHFMRYQSLVDATKHDARTHIVDKPMLTVEEWIQKLNDKLNENIQAGDLNAIGKQEVENLITALNTTKDEAVKNRLKGLELLVTVVNKAQAEAKQFENTTLKALVNRSVITACSNRMVFSIKQEMNWRAVMLQHAEKIKYDFLSIVENRSKLKPFGTDRIYLIFGPEAQQYEFSDTNGTRHVLSAYERVHKVRKKFEKDRPYQARIDAREALPEPVLPAIAVLNAKVMKRHISPVQGLAQLEMCYQTAITEINFENENHTRIGSKFKDRIDVRAGELKKSIKMIPVLQGVTFLNHVIDKLGEDLAIRLGVHTLKIENPIQMLDDPNGAFAQYRLALENMKTLYKKLASRADLLSEKDKAKTIATSGIKISSRKIHDAIMRLKTHAEINHDLDMAITAVDNQRRLKEVAGKQLLSGSDFVARVTQ